MNNFHNEHQLNHHIKNVPIKSYPTKISTNITSRSLHLQLKNQNKNINLTLQTNNQPKYQFNSQNLHQHPQLKNKQPKSISKYNNSSLLLNNQTQKSVRNHRKSKNYYSSLQMCQKYSKKFQELKSQIIEACQHYRSKPECIQTPKKILFKILNRKNQINGKISKIKQKYINLVIPRYKKYNEMSIQQILKDNSQNQHHHKTSLHQNKSQSTLPQIY